jgi:glycosyltransferase involved in cell wall biosynthesis
MFGDYQAPRIEPVPAGTPRPAWSVMIPAFHCAAYLRQTLESVLAQDPGPEQMQIEVVDDCSTKDDPEGVVREAGKGRVAFYRKPMNEGVCANFNTCIERSRGRLVHILHGDDYLAPGFYQSVGQALESHPCAGLAIVRCFQADRDGQIEYLGKRLTKDTEVFHALPDQLYENSIFAPAVVARRSAYEEHGGFSQSFLHVADWEMWDRLTHFAGGIFLNEPLAFYRLYPENDTNRLARTADNLRDTLRLEELFATRHPEFRRDLFQECVTERAWKQYQRFRDLGDTAAAEANYLLWYQLFRKTAPWHRRIRLDVKIALKSGFSELGAYAEAHAPQTVPLLRTVQGFFASRLL